MINKIKILGLDYDIIINDDNCRSDDYMGRADMKLLQITLSKSMPKENQMAILLHETMHAINDMLAIGLDEKQVAALASGLYPSLKYFKEEI